MKNMSLKRTYFLQNQVTNKQTSSFYLVLLVLSHQLYSLRGHHIESISSQTVTISFSSSRVAALNYFSPFSTKHNIYYCWCHLTHLMYFCCCQYQLLSSTLLIFFPIIWWGYYIKTKRTRLSVRMNEKECFENHVFINFEPSKMVFFNQFSKQIKLSKN